MDYQRFLKQLPSLYENWEGGVRPKSKRFQKVLDRVQGMKIPNVMQLLNFAVECMEPEEVYCEVGCFQGANLIGALLEHPERLAYAVDDFPELEKNSFEKLMENLTNFNLENQVLYCDRDFRSFFSDIQNIEVQDKIGVYFYDDAWDYRSTLMGLLLVRPFLANRAIIVVGNTSLKAVSRAACDFIAINTHTRSLDILTNKPNNSSFWNGLQIISWDVDKHHRSSNSCLQTELLHCQETVANLENFSGYLSLGNALLTQQKIDEAIAAHKIALKLSLQNADILDKLDAALEVQTHHSLAFLHQGDILYSQRKYKDAITEYQKFLETQTGDGYFYFRLAECYKSLDRYEAAITIYREGIRLYPNTTYLYSGLLLSLQMFGRTQESIEVASGALQLLPEHLYFRLYKYLTLPIIYDTEEEIHICRNQFTQGLEEVIRQTNLDNPEAINNALKGLSNQNNFHLQYQGYNDLELQKKYGQFIQRVVTAKYPQWAEDRHMLPLNRNEKIRIGYISDSMRLDGVGKVYLGWLSNFDRQKFEVYCYYTGNNRDQLSHQFQLYSHTFHHIPNDLEAICRQILDDQLHILVFPDIGIDPLSAQIAGLRLAPIQCATSAHPVTSGLPTIDYFLSGNLMEPENAQNHYLEQLVCLPNTGFSYAKPMIPEVTKSRSDFHLREDAVVYLSCQSLSKYLPQHDYIFPEIAQRVFSAQFAFVSSHLSPHITEQFRQRLQRAFTKCGLEMYDYCVIVPRQDPTGYLNLMLASDIFLDTFSYSGGITTLDAITCNLPIVTCPGELMRGRQSYAFLKMLGVTETIAKNEAEYIEIATGLGLNPAWRGSIVRQTSQRHSYLYDDRVCVAALEDFYQRVVRQHSVSS